MDQWKELFFNNDIDILKENIEKFHKESNEDVYKEYNQGPSLNDLKFFKFMKLNYNYSIYTISYHTYIRRYKNEIYDDCLMSDKELEEFIISKTKVL